LKNFRSAPLTWAWLILILAAALYGQAGVPANISVVQGNGQLICDQCSTFPLNAFDPLVVLVTDSNGNPVSNATVTWNVTASSTNTLGTVSATAIGGGATTATSTTGGRHGSFRGSLQYF
jgi:hypothetical protein